MNPAVIAAFKDIESIAPGKYLSYWGSLTPKTDADRFRRWLFAFCSVHTTWEGNIKGYAAIADFDAWAGDHSELRDRLISSRCGMHNNRAKWIFRFHEQFWKDPSIYRPQVGESWRDARNRIMLKICGLGFAKTSFALELHSPLGAQTTCLDVHMLRLYGATEKQYHVAEADWLGRSAALGLPPYITRSMYWDKIQNQPDSRYWSHVLEAS